MLRHISPILISFAFASACADAPPNLDDFGPPLPTITGVVQLDGPEVRQGGTVRVRVTGEALERTTAVVVDADVSQTIIQDGLELTIAVAHGAPSGPRDLRLTFPEGALDHPAVLVVTLIHVGPSGDDDARGTPAAPLRTLGRAVALAAAGDAIRLSSGRHIVDDATLVPAGVTVHGSGIGATTIEIPGCGTWTVCFGGAGVIELLSIESATHAELPAQRPVALYGGGALLGVEVRGGYVGVEVADGSLLQVDIASAHEGVRVGGGRAHITGSRITGSMTRGLFVFDSSQPTELYLSDSIISGSSDGVSIFSTISSVKVVATGTRVSSSGVGVRIVRATPASEIDFGSTTSQTANTFTANTLHIRDERAACTTCPAASFVGATFDGVDPSGTFVGPAASPPIFELLGSGQRLQF